MINCNLCLSAPAYFNEGAETKLYVLREDPQKENNKVGQSTHGGLCQRKETASKVGAENPNRQNFSQSWCVQKVLVRIQSSSEICGDLELDSIFTFQETVLSQAPFPVNCFAPGRTAQRPAT
ncbi:hypothetical protein Q8A67_021455 [Cirrhinus molitorella]|uniref:Uncharacterized protein n=1 Tax=Cirrhinus molitorella TaxID=172907 RepID=A0AA88TG43_9TELE|nr:hypothetical protein Q8A67_021455 [Cirrhinus molitorella]